MTSYLDDDLSPLQYRVYAGNVLMASYSDQDMANDKAAELRNEFTFSEVKVVDAGPAFISRNLDL